MASQGNRSVKQKTLKAKKMDIESGKARKYQSRRVEPKEARISDIKAAVKGEHITPEEGQVYTESAKSFEAERPKKTRSKVAPSSPEVKKSLEKNYPDTRRPFNPGNPKDAQEKAAVRLAERAHGLGITASMSGESRKVVQSELSDVQKRVSAGTRRRAEKEVDTAIAKAATKDLAPGEKSLKEKLVARGEEHAAKRKAGSSRVITFKPEGTSIPKGLPKSPGQPKEAKPNLGDTLPSGVSAGVARRFKRKQKYNAMRAQEAGSSQGYQIHAEPGARAAASVNTVKQEKFENTVTRGKQVAANLDIQRDKLKKTKLESATTPKEKRQAEAIIQEPKKTTSSGTEYRPGPTVQRTFVDPAAIDKKYKREVPLGAPRMTEKLEKIGPAKVGTKKTGHEITPISAPDKETAGTMALSHEHALHEVSVKIFGEKGAEAGKRHITSFLRSHKGAGAQQSAYHALHRASVKSPEKFQRVAKMIKTHAQMQKGREQEASEKRQAQRAAESAARVAESGKKPRKSAAPKAGGAVVSKFTEVNKPQ